MSIKRFNKYINGELVNALDNEFYEDLNSYKAEVFIYVPLAKSGDAKRAIDVTVRSFLECSLTHTAERRALFLRALKILKKRKKF